MIDYKRITAMSPYELLRREGEILWSLDDWHGASEIGELKRELHAVRAEIADRAPTPCDCDLEPLDNDEDTITMRGAPKDVVDYLMALGCELAPSQTIGECIVWRNGHRVGRTYHDDYTVPVRFASGPKVIRRTVLVIHTAITGIEP